MPLSDLKKAIKEFKLKETPKLSSKKSVLTDYAMRVGILKTKGSLPEMVDTPPEVLKPKAKKPEAKKADPPVVLKAEVKKPAAKKAELPAVLKAPEPKSLEAKIEAKKKAPFAEFMAAHKGKGLSMSQLADAYRKAKA
jgi:hypothetical protein